MSDHGEHGQEAAPAPRRSFTPEFKAEIVELCGRGDRTVGQVARDFDVTETAVRAWIKQAELDSGVRTDGLTSTERQELAQLRRGNSDSRVPPSEQGRQDTDGAQPLLCSVSGQR